MLMMLINGICLAIGFWFVTVVMAALSGAAKKTEENNQRLLECWNERNRLHSLEVEQLNRIRESIQTYLDCQ